MITNDRQYRVTKAQLTRLEKALATRGGNGGGIHPRLHEAIRGGLRSEIEELRDQITEYERLKASAVTDLKLETLDELPSMLVKARVAQGLTQEALARRLGMKEQQIQRYEANRYRSASFQRILRVAGALGIDLKEPTRLRRVSGKKR